MTHNMCALEIQPVSHFHFQGIDGIGPLSLDPQRKNDMIMNYTLKVILCYYS